MLTLENCWGNVNPDPDHAISKEKRFAEALFIVYHKQYGLNVKIARIFNSFELLNGLEKDWFRLWL